MQLFRQLAPPGTALARAAARGGGAARGGACGGACGGAGGGAWGGAGVDGAGGDGMIARADFVSFGADLLQVCGMCVACAWRVRGVFVACAWY